MIQTTTLRLSGCQHAAVQAHLFPGDHREAAAILVCSRAGRRRRSLITRTWLAVPHEACGVRTRNSLTWPGEWLEAAIDLAERETDTLVLVHSHPAGLFAFSEVDDQSDARVMPALAEALDAPHASAIMIPSGAMRGRFYEGGAPQDIDRIIVAGDDYRLFRPDDDPDATPSLAFTSGMTADLAQLSACIVGVSGTGSLLAEQACRMGFGEVTLVDPDKIEAKNLNRIVNATCTDADERVLKVNCFAAAAATFAPNVKVVALGRSILDRDAVLAAGEADILFSCVDSHEGRQICDLIAAAFGLPLIDMGVQIPLRGLGDAQAIAGVYGRVDYVQPDGSRLEDRGVYTPASLLAEHLARVAPDQHANELQEGYVKGRAEEAPSVIALNMRAASTAMLEFVARVWPFRSEPNRQFARVLFNVGDGEEDRISEDEFSYAPDPLAGSGEREPLLGLPALKVRKP